MPCATPATLDGRAAKMPLGQGFRGGGPYSALPLGTPTRRSCPPLLLGAPAQPMPFTAPRHARAGSSDSGWLGMAAPVRRARPALDRFPTRPSDSVALFWRRPTHSPHRTGLPARLAGRKSQPGSTITGNADASPGQQRDLGPCGRESSPRSGRRSLRIAACNRSVAAIDRQSRRDRRSRRSGHVDQRLAPCRHVRWPRRKDLSPHQPQRALMHAHLPGETSHFHPPLIPDWTRPRTPETGC